MIPDGSGTIKEDNVDLLATATGCKFTTTPFNSMDDQRRGIYALPGLKAYVMLNRTNSSCTTFAGDFEENPYVPVYGAWSMYANTDQNWRAKPCTLTPPIPLTCVAYWDDFACHNNNPFATKANINMPPSAPAVRVVNATMASKFKTAKQYLLNPAANPLSPTTNLSSSWPAHLYGTLPSNWGDSQGDTGKPAFSNLVGM